MSQEELIDKKYRDFTIELQTLIVRHGMNEDSSTPDFILADYLASCLRNYGYAVTRRDSWSD